MRQQFLIPTAFACGLVVSGCAKETEEEKVERTFQEVNVIDETNLNDVMLTAADPNEAVTYFLGAASKNPDRIDLQRGLAISLTRAKRNDRSGSGLETRSKHEGRERMTTKSSTRMRWSVVVSGKVPSQLLDSIPSDL